MGIRDRGWRGKRTVFEKHVLVQETGRKLSITTVGSVTKCAVLHETGLSKGEAEGSREKSRIEVAILDAKNFT